jgi:hypothetical protein
MRENDKLRNDRCGFYFHSLNRISSGTTEIERWIRENDIPGNDRSKFHCTASPSCKERNVMYCVFLILREKCDVMHLPHIKRETSCTASLSCKERNVLWCISFIERENCDVIHLPYAKKEMDSLWLHAPEVVFMPWSYWLKHNHDGRCHST